MTSRGDFLTRRLLRPAMPAIVLLTIAVLGYDAWKSPEKITLDASAISTNCPTPCRCVSPSSTR